MSDVKVKKPIYKKWWFWLIAVLIVFSAVIGGNQSSSDDNAVTNEKHTIATRATDDEPLSNRDREKKTEPTADTSSTEPDRSADVTSAPETTEATTTPTPTKAPETTTEATTSKSETKSGGDYVLNTNTMKFHYPKCNSVEDIKPENRVDYKGDYNDIISQGYKPCKRCHP